MIEKCALDERRPGSSASPIEPTLMARITSCSSSASVFGGAVSAKASRAYFRTSILRCSVDSLTASFAPGVSSAISASTSRQSPGLARCAMRMGYVRVFFNWYFLERFEVVATAVVPLPVTDVHAFDKRK